VSLRLSRPSSHAILSVEIRSCPDHRVGNLPSARCQSFKLDAPSPSLRNQHPWPVPGHPLLPRRVPQGADRVAKNRTFYARCAAVGTALDSDRVGDLACSGWALRLLVPLAGISGD